jgi:AcrR family transcriptional regulator
VARKPADQAVNREDILAAAADILRENGYESATMKDIAARVNLTAASLYHHFENKDTLLLSVLELGLDFAIDEMQAVLALDLPAAEKLARMISLHVESVTSNTAVGAAMVFEVHPLLREPVNDHHHAATGGEPDRHRRAQFLERRDFFERQFRQVVQAGIDGGEFRAVDVPIFTKAMLGAHNWVGVWFRVGGRLTGAEVAAMMVDFFLKALGAGHPAHSD